METRVLKTTEKPLAIGPSAPMKTPLRPGTRRRHISIFFFSAGHMSTTPLILRDFWVRWRKKRKEEEEGKYTSKYEAAKWRQPESWAVKITNQESAVNAGIYFNVYCPRHKYLITHRVTRVGNSLFAHLFVVRCTIYTPTQLPAAAIINTGSRERPAARVLTYYIMRAMRRARLPLTNVLCATACLLFSIVMFFLFCLFFPCENVVSSRTSEAILRWTDALKMSL